MNGKEVINNIKLVNKKNKLKQLIYKMKQKKKFKLKLIIITIINKTNTIIMKITKRVIKIP